ncbi:MAG: tetratricopeptide repeat protein [Deltaproteobacteria bacterium]|nr:tetratricopeptide repeat protein [Deltaproteobacteria bacterium]
MTSCKRLGLLRYGFTLLSAFLFTVGALRPAIADDIDDMTTSMRQLQASVNKLRSQHLDVHGYRGVHYAESRLVDGVNHYDLKDYQRASIILLDVVENFPGHAVFPEALFYYADSLFLARDYYGARTEFQRFLNEGEKNGFLLFRPAAISRLVEVAVHLDDFHQVGDYIELLEQKSDATARYITGKYYYFQGDYEKARAEFAHVKDNEELQLKAAYFIGATLIKEARLEDAVAAFQQAVEKYPEVRPSYRQLQDLLFLGYGRVLYEMDDVENAMSAYGHIDKFSPYYDAALYESAAVNMRAGNTIGAERILEVLTVSIPDSRYIPRAKLLRGQLLASAGRYEEAETVFGQTIEEFSPVEEMMDKALAQSGDTGEFFDLLMARSVDTLNVQSLVPREVVIWAGEEPEVKRAFLVTDDLAKAQEFTSESKRLAELIGAVVNGTNPVNAIPLLRSGMRRNQQYRNQLARLTVRFLRELEDDVPPSLVAKLASQRARLEAAVSDLPIDDKAFKTRERDAREKYTALRQELARYEVMLDKLQAVIVGLETYIEKPDYRSQVSKSVLDGYWSQLARYNSVVKNIRDEMASVKLDIEKARYQAGIGGEEDQRDTAVVEMLFALTEEYSQMTRHSGRKASRYKSALATLLKTILVVDRLSQDIEVAATDEVAKIRTELASEEAKLRQYQIQLEALNTEAREVVNGVARENFSGIRKRFEELMIKADVGIIDIAWMKKEEHKSRAVQLSRNRTNEIQWLDDEFEEADGFGGKSTETGE